MLIEKAFDDFFEDFTPVKNHIDDNACLEGCMFETYGAELEHVQKVFNETPNRVWTYGEFSGAVYINDGLHWVNRLGFIITEEDAEQTKTYCYSEDTEL